MSVVMQINPFEFFADTQGDPLDAGYVWIGLPNTDPRQYPVTAYYDEALTIPAAMPLRTSGGYIVRDGSPTFLYINGNYSVLVQDKNQRQLFYVPDFLLIGSGTAVTLGELANTTDPTKGISLIPTASRLVPNIATLRTLPKIGGSTAVFVQGYYSIGDNGGGNYYLDAADVTSTDNGGTIIVAADGGRWKLIYKDSVTVKQFGCKGDGASDDTAALANVRAWLAAVPVKPKLSFPEGRYVYTTSPNWAIDHAEIVADGVVYLRNTGTGHSVIIDGGASVGGVFGLRMGVGNKFIVEGGASSGDGVYARSLLQGCNIDFQINGAGTLFSGMNVEFAVCATIGITCSNNTQGFTWYSRPANGLKLNRRNAGELCSYCYFPNPILEGTSSAGALLDWAQGNVFMGGTMEGIASTGMKLTANAIKNKVFGTDFEVNTDHDIFCEGRGNEFYGLNTENRITFDGIAAVTNRIFGGSHSKIFINANTLHNLVSGATYNQNDDGSTITDLSGGKVRLRDNYNQGIGRVENVPPGSPIVIAVGPSPFEFQNLGDNEVDVLISGNVNGISFTRNGITNLSGTLGGMFRLTPLDIITISYPAATPSMVEYTR
jgi:hypothetical protein